MISVSIYGIKWLLDEIKNECNEHYYYHEYFINLHTKAYEKGYMNNKKYLI